MINHKELEFLIIGAAAGFVSYLSVITFKEFQFLPGVIYGLIIGLYLRFNLKQFTNKHLIVFTILSMLGYFISVQTVIRQGRGFNYDINAEYFVTAGLLGGGSFIALLSVIFKIKKLSYILFSIMLSGVLGLSWFLPNIYYTFLGQQQPDITSSFFTLYVCWQAVMSPVIFMLFNNEDIK